MALTLKQELFCQYYMGESLGNGADSMRRAGYNSSNYSRDAYELLQKPHVQLRLAELRAEAPRLVGPARIAEFLQDVALGVAMLEKVVGDQMVEVPWPPRLRIDAAAQLMAWYARGTDDDAVTMKQLRDAYARGQFQPTQEDLQVIAGDGTVRQKAAYARRVLARLEEAGSN